VGSDSKNGVRHQRALSPRLSMMMMMTEPGLLELVQKVAGVRFFETQCIRPTVTLKSEI